MPVDGERVANTVTGSVRSSELGVTLAHDHVFCVQPLVTEYQHVPEGASGGVDDPTMVDAPVSLEHLWWIRQNWLSSRDNLVVTDPGVATEELVRFAGAGGGTIVDPSVDGVGRNPLALARVSRATGVNIVVGSGYYVDETHPEWLRAASPEAIAARIESDILNGIDDTDIRAGLIGEIGCTWPLTDSERRVLEASAIAQRSTGAALMIHPGRDRRSPFEIVAHLEASGALLSRVVIAHLDRTVQDVSGLVELAEMGPFIELDMFGLETSQYPYFWTGIDVLSDAQRIAIIESLLESGLRDRILISHDICTKHRLARYGGHGYDHILRNVVPWMRRRGVTEEELESILVRNPADAFALLAH
jgi:phosphotriesterase-related protein